MARPGGRDRHALRGRPASRRRAVPGDVRRPVPAGDLPGPRPGRPDDGRAPPLNLVWYDPQQRELLQEAGLLDGETVRGSLAPGALPEDVRRRLAAFAAATWPSPWREALALALETGVVFGTPIVHYRPSRLVNGRVALAGDAAHAASPMVGGGFRQGLYDVRALSQTMSAVTSPDEVMDALDRYQRLRLGPAKDHVSRSERATAAYLAQAGV